MSRRLAPRAFRLLLAGAALFPQGCAEGTQHAQTSDTLRVSIQSVWAPELLPGSRLWLIGSGFYEGATVDVTLEGTVEGTPVRLVLPAARYDDTTVAVDVPGEQLAAIPTGDLVGDLVVEASVGEARGRAVLPVRLPVLHELAPSVSLLPTVAFPATPIVFQGEGLLFPGEGETVAGVRGRFVRDRDGTGIDVSLTELPFQTQAGDVPAEPDRTAGRLTIPTAAIGIEPGHFEGEIQLSNRGLGWAADAPWVPFRFDLAPPQIDAVAPLEASRGARITVTGQGFLGPADGLTFIRLEGDFTPAVGPRRSLPADGLTLSPVWLSPTELGFTMRVHYDADCQSSDLGANPGFLEGMATPIVTAGDATVEGTAVPLSFAVLPSRQIVWLRFLPAFTESLRTFGLRNVSGPIQDRVLEILSRDYAEVAMDFRLTEPQDYLDYSILEFGGPDPNNQNLFGLDNTPNLDRCNERLADNLAGRHADGGGYGGIFVESFHQFSPALGGMNPLADPAFDERLGPFDPDRGEPVEPGEYPSGPRAAAIAEAVRTLGTLIGNTATHELGHSLGLPVSPGCGEYHTPAGPLQIMDCGADRPFYERAELDGTSASFNPEDLDYLKQVLPLR